MGSGIKWAYMRAMPSHEFVRTLNTSGLDTWTTDIVRQSNVH
jgi:hypothetical protein